MNSAVCTLSVPTESTNAFLDSSRAYTVNPASMITTTRKTAAILMPSFEDLRPRKCEVTDTKVPPPIRLLGRLV